MCIVLTVYFICERVGFKSGLIFHCFLSYSVLQHSMFSALLCFVTLSSNCNLENLICALYAISLGRQVLYNSVSSLGNHGYLVLIFF